MVRSIIALVGGFAIMVFLVFLLTIVAAAAFGVTDGAPSMPFTVASLTLSAVAALIGGYATASLAPGRPFVHTIGLSVMILAASLSSLGHPQPGEPAWYPAAIAALGPLLALAGGGLRLWQRRARTLTPAP
jgi:hypothetical protein